MGKDQVKTQYQLDAVVRLDPPLIVHADAKGRSYDVKIGGKEMKLTLPRNGVATIPMSDAPTQDLKLPEFPRPALTEALTPKVHVQISVGRKMPDHILAANAIRLRWCDQTVVSSDDEFCDPSELSDAIGEWVSIVRDWIAEWTGNVRKSVEGEPRPAVEIALVADPKRMALQGGGAIPVLVQGQRAATTAEVAAAFRAASSSVELPLERKLLMEAVVLFHKGRFREAVINCCSAAEVALSSAVAEALSDIGKSPDEVDEILGGVKGVVDLYRLAATRRQPYEVSIGRVTHQLAGQRNLAVHQGKQLDEEGARKALSTARSLLACRPVPSSRNVARPARSTGGTNPSE